MDPMKEKRGQLKSLLKELQAGQVKLSEKGSLAQNESEALDAKAEEAEALQTEIDSYDQKQRRLQGVLDNGCKVADAGLPPDHQEGGESKGTGAGMEFKLDDYRRSTASDGERVVGYMRLGQFVTAQKALQDFVRAGAPKQQTTIASVPSLIMLKGMSQPVVPVSASQVKAAYESKAVPTFGDEVIDPIRLPEIIRVDEHDRLQLRDVLDIQQTSSDAVKFTRIVSYTRAAGTVAHSAQKPQAAMAMDSVTEPVKTIAVWMPVEEQQLSDYPALSGLINGELLYDVDKHLEELVMYGDGTGEDFSGILNDAAVLDARTASGDTLIDISRRGITDVRRAGYEPNAIMIDPLDWEDIVLEKGNDNRYIWVVVTEGATQRLWAVPVIESVAMEDFQGNSTEARNLLVGDFARGATLWDRMRSQIAVGWINDQFIRNQRTILAEMRAAFGVKRPGAFRKHQTQAASSS